MDRSSRDEATTQGEAPARERSTSFAIEEVVENVPRFLDDIVENIPLMVFVKDAEELRFVRINQAGEELLGIAAYAHRWTNWRLVNYRQRRPAPEHQPAWPIHSLSEPVQLSIFCRASGVWLTMPEKASAMT